ASPATAAAPTPAPAPMAEKSAPVPEPAPAAQQMSAEDASTHHDSFYGDPANEMIGLESKVAEARLADLDPLAPSAAAIPDAPVAPGSATAKQDQPSSDKAPWWFESETGAAKPATQSTPAPEPAWTPSDAGSSGASPFSTDASSLAEGIDPAVDEHEIDNPHYVAVGGGFFDYEPGDDEADGATSDASEAEAPSAATAPAESPAWTAPEPSPVAVPTPEPEAAFAEPEAAIGDEPAWASETDWDPDPAADYPSIDGAGGLEEGLPIAAPVEEEMEYPSIDGDGDLGIAPDDSTIPPDWYPDPDDPNRYRWWDGVDWTDYVSESGS
ncbi:MAG: DUF2510 domain-containing protein, partial [Microthrixaceae bacterium]|nr:DUF2510 domain-containing protein [Microthrixaceae bacterium]